jgi:hypothetical protein
MNRLTEARKALIERLSVISPANGYLTAAGSNVKTGWLNEILEEATTGFPLIVIQPAKGQPPGSKPGALMVWQGFSVVGAIQAGTNYEDALDDLQLDLLQCLMPGHQRFPKWLPLGVTNIQIGTPEPFPPGGGLTAATILIPVYLSTIIEGQVT